MNRNEGIQNGAHHFKRETNRWAIEKHNKSKYRKKADFVYQCVCSLRSLCLTSGSELMENETQKLKNFINIW